MKQKLFIAAAALAVLASCSQDNEIAKESVQNNEPVAISFGTYASQGLTRAANQSDIKTAEDIKDLDGFGVFAFYTDAYKTDESTKLAPNFMYNQQVTGDGTSDITWSYSPVKYWPNGINPADNDTPNKAEGSESNKLSFFAYAPYSDGSKYGISNFSGKSTAGNPTLDFTIDATTPTDLLWGTAGSNTLSKVGSTYPGTSQSGSPSYTDSPYKVWLDLTKPSSTGDGSKVKFNFVHALAKIGGNGAGNGDIKIQLVSDDETGLTNTKVTVTDIKITTTGSDDAHKFNTKGTFDLATGLWKGQTTSSDYSQTFTVSGSGTGEIKLNEVIAEPSSVSQWSDLTQNGVTTTAVSVFDSSADEAPKLFIPGTTPTIKVQVTYYVRTEDSKLNQGYTEVKQTVSKDITLPEIKINSIYGLLIRLGLTSVKFDVNTTVTEWTVVEGGTGTGQASVDLPKVD